MTKKNLNADLPVPYGKNNIDSIEKFVRASCDKKISESEKKTITLLPP